MTKWHNYKTMKTNGVAFLLVRENEAAGRADQPIEKRPVADRVIKGLVSNYLRSSRVQRLS